MMGNESITIEQFIYIAGFIICFILTGYIICYFNEKRDRKRKAERFDEAYME